MSRAGKPRRPSWWWAGLVPVAVVLAACVPPPPPPLPASPLFQAACNGDLQGNVAGSVESTALTETSGAAASRANPGVLWAHNDSGDTPRVFAMTSSGHHLSWFQLAGASAVDWEDMAIGPGPQPGQSYLYLADIGDNNHVRTSIVVYRVPEPAINTQQPPAEGQTLANVTAFTMQYPDGPHDAEALAVDPASGDLVIVTKEISGQAGVYSHQASAASSTLDRKSPISLGAGTLVTGAGATPDGTAVVLRTYTSVLVFPHAPSTPLDEAFGFGSCDGASAAEPQGEAIAVTPDGRGYVTISEGAQPPINRFAF